MQVVAWSPKPGFPSAFALGAFWILPRYFFSGKGCSRLRRPESQLSLQEKWLQRPTCSFQKLQAGQADALRCYFSHVKLILERSDNGQTQPGKGTPSVPLRAMTPSRMLILGRIVKVALEIMVSSALFIHSDRQARTVALYQINKTHYRNKRRTPATSR